MFIFESDLYNLLAVGAGISIGLPLYTYTVRLTTRALDRLFPAKPNPADRVDMPAPVPYPGITPPPATTR